VFEGFSESDFDIFQKNKIRRETNNLKHQRKVLNQKFRSLSDALQDYMKNLDQRFIVDFSRYWFYRKNQMIYSMRLSYIFDKPYTEFPQLNVEIYHDQIIVFIFIPPSFRKWMSQHFVASPSSISRVFRQLNPNRAYARVKTEERYTELSSNIVKRIGMVLGEENTWFVMGESFERDVDTIYEKKEFVRTIQSIFLKLFPLFLIAQGEATRANRLLSPRRYSMIRDAAERIGGRMKEKEIVDYVCDNYDNINRDAITSLIRAYTVNNPKRIGGYDENKRASDDPRRRSEFYDILFRPNPKVTEVELYDPNKHGIWIIRKTKRDRDNPYGFEVVCLEDIEQKEPRKSKRKTSTRKRGKLSPTPKPPPPTGPQERTEYDESRLKFPRDQKVVDWVKEKEGGECQVCGWSIKMPNGDKWIEVHHIWPLGEPHYGFENKQDRVENAICLCPNHHRQMHRGLFYIKAKSHKIIFHDLKNPHHNTKLHLHPEHNLDEEVLKYHQREIYKRWKDSI